MFLWGKDRPRKDLLLMGRSTSFAGCTSTDVPMKNYKVVSLINTMWPSTEMPVLPPVPLPEHSLPSSVSQLRQTHGASFPHRAQLAPCPCPDVGVPLDVVHAALTSRARSGPWPPALVEEEALTLLDTVGKEMARADVRVAKEAVRRATEVQAVGRIGPASHRLLA